MMGAIVKLLEDAIAAIKSDDGSHKWVYDEVDSFTKSVKELAEIARIEVAKLHAPKPGLHLPEGYVHEAVEAVVHEVEVVKEKVAEVVEQVKEEVAQAVEEVKEAVPGKKKAAKAAESNKE